LLFQGLKLAKVNLRLPLSKDTKLEAVSMPTFSKEIAFVVREMRGARRYEGLDRKFGARFRLHSGLRQSGAGLRPGFYGPTEVGPFCFVLDSVADEGRSIPQGLKPGFVVRPEAQASGYLFVPELQKQIPYGNDNQESRGKSKNKGTYSTITRPPWGF
jgi:hypothetical protein